MVKKIKEFIKHNSILNIIAGIAVIISIVYMASYNLNEWYSGLGILFEFIYNLCLAYLGSFIFYIIQVYIPDKNKLERLNARMHKCLLMILYEISSIEENINKLDDCIKEIDKQKEKLSNENVMQIYKELVQRGYFIMQYLNKTINNMEEYINKIRFTNREGLDSLNIHTQEWIEQYVEFKINRREYHNGELKSEILYYKNLLEILKMLQDYYSIDELEKKLNMNTKLSDV